MIIFLIFVVLLVSGILLYKFGDDEITAVAVFEILSLFVGSLGFLITGCIILCSHVEATKQISTNRSQRISLNTRQLLPRFRLLTQITRTYQKS